MNTDALKSQGVIQEKTGDRFRVRLGVVGGYLDTESLLRIGNLAQQYGNGSVHLTTRQALEIPHVASDQLPTLLRGLAESGFVLSATGKRVRTITACPGISCRFGMADTQRLAQTLNKRVGQRDGLPHKFKIGITGCPNGCTKPIENDLGIMGIGQGFAVFVGGKMGKRPRLGNRLPMKIADEPTLLQIVDAVIDWFAANGEDRERFGSTIDRVGIDSLTRYLQTITNLHAA